MFLEKLFKKEKQELIIFCPNEIIFRMFCNDIPILYYYNILII